MANKNVYSAHITKTTTRTSKVVTPQTQVIPGREADMATNNAGGVSFVLTPLKQAERFLVLGSDSPTYYTGERKLTKDNAKVIETLANDPIQGKLLVDLIVDVSVNGRAPKNDPAIFALALAANSTDTDVRKYALSKVNDVCRIGTHLFQFTNFTNELRGWGRAVRKAIGGWYEAKTPDQLAYQTLKYQSREGFNHADVMRLAHPKLTGASNDVAKYVVERHKATDKRSQNFGAMITTVGGKVEGYHLALEAKDEPKKIVKLIDKYGLTHEMLPKEALAHGSVWEALLQNDMPMTAMIRNLGNLGKHGLLVPNSDNVKTVVNALTDVDALQKSRLHPLAILMAQSVYGSGHSIKGDGTWTPTTTVVDALEDAFKLSFSNIVPSKKRFLIGLDVSGSMGCGTVGGSMLTPRQASVAMCLVTLAAEPWCETMAFSTSFMPVNFTKRSTLKSAIAMTDRLPFSGTDCSLPMLYAAQNKIPVDVFAVYTDSETWAGHIQPVQALRDYRKKMGIDAKLVVVGMTATNVTIADPKDTGMLDVVGFDASAPAIMSDFASR